MDPVLGYVQSIQTAFPTLSAPSNPTTQVATTSGGLPILNATNATINPDKAQADITRAQWEYAKEFFQPLEDDIINKITADVEPEADRAGANARRGFNATLSSAKRDIGRSTAGMTARQREAMKRQINLGRATTTASAENLTRRGLQERNINLLAQMAGIGRGISQNATSGLSTAADAKSARDNAHAAALQQHKQSQMGLGASLAGAALAFLI